MVDRVPFQPALIAHFTDASQGARSNAFDQGTALPNQACAKADETATQTARERSACRLCPAKHAEGQSKLQ